jgi:hypothetical protein
MMKTTFFIASLVAAASAQDFYNITSKPFQLLLTSENGTINSTVSACHTGAAIESFCLLNSNETSADSSTFNFNSSIYAQAPPNNPSLGVPGILTWFLPVGNIGPVPSSATFSNDPSTNLVVPLLEPGSSNAQTLAFNDKDELILQSYIDWTANPPKAVDPYGLKRWYACRTLYLGYEYENLAWGLGTAKPDNPTCVAVNVTRLWV